MRIKLVSNEKVYLSLLFWSVTFGIQTNFDIQEKYGRTIFELINKKEKFFASLPFKNM